MLADIRSLLGDKIKWYRQRAGLSQQALADALKANKATVWRLENGETWPELPTLEGIAGALGVDLEALFAWGTPSPAAAIEVLQRELAVRAAVPVPAQDPLAARLAKLPPDAQEIARVSIDLVLQGLEPPLAPHKAPKRSRENEK